MVKLGGFHSHSRIATATVSTVFPPIGGFYFSSEVSEPALIGNGVSDQVLIFYSELSGPALIRGGAYWRKYGT